MPKNVRNHKLKEDENNPTPQYYPAPSQPSQLLIIILVAMSFFAGYLLAKVRSYETAGTGTKQVAGTNQPQAADQAAQAQPTRPSELKIKKPDNSEHWRGDANARYVWVEYTDLECPFCKKIHPDLAKLFAEYSGKMAWVARNYPLPFHPKAQKSAEATECAAELGGNEAYWQMNDLIFEKMPDMELSQLPSLAAEVGLDQTAFSQCLDSGKFEKKVKDQQSEGSQAGVQATPTGVIYDMQTGKTKLVEGAVPYETLKSELEAFMKG